jgi:two-component system, NtrC family, response regulator AtoC
MRKLKILIIDDEKLIGWTFQQKLSKKGYEVLTTDSAEEGLELFQREDPDIVFLDNKLPKMQGLELLPKLTSLNKDAVLVFMTAYGSIDTAIRAIKYGAYDYIAKPFNFNQIDAVLGKIKEKISTGNELKILRSNQPVKIGFNNIINQSKSMKDIIELAKKICTSDACSVLLMGESGTGKDLIAKAIHNESNRKDKPFVTINCSSLPETLLESELFGHERGAFTDAHKQKKGLFEIADQGTVFLDEIGEASLSVQVKLLNIIENRVFRRIGNTKDINVDIRIIAATNQDIASLIKTKRFRYDLYYRLKVFQIDIPPLRERKEDIPQLIEYFINYFNKTLRKNILGVTKEAEELLCMYDWPGNVRELRNIIEHAVILETNEIVQKAHLPIEIKETEAPIAIGAVDKWFDIPDEGFSLYDVEKAIIKQTLYKAGNNQTLTAKLMNVSRDTLRYKMKKYNL